MEKKVKVIGFDANDDEIQDLKDGKVNGLIVQNPFGMGYNRCGCSKGFSEYGK